MYSYKEKLNKKLIKNLSYQFMNKKHLINKAVEFVRPLYLFSSFFAKLNCMSVLHLQIFLFFLHAYIYKFNVLILPFIRLWPKYGRNAVFRRCFFIVKSFKKPFNTCLIDKLTYFFHYHLHWHSEQCLATNIRGYFRAKWKLSMLILAYKSCSLGYSSNATVSLPVS